MIQYYDEPQGIKIKTNMVKWDKVNPEFLVAALKSNSMNKNHYLNNIAKQSLDLYNQQNNAKINGSESLLFNIGKVIPVGSNSCYLEINFYLPVKGYSGIKFASDWVILWVEKVAYNLAKVKSFDDWINGFESRYPDKLLERMKNTWNDFK